MPNLKPSAVGPESCQLDGDGMKTCSTCKTEKPRGEFHRNASAKDGLSYVCRVCAIAKTKAHRANNLEAVRAYDRARGKLPHRLEANRKQYYAERPKHLARVKEYARAHPERARKAKAAYKVRNPAKVTSDTRRRQIRKLNATPTWANQFFIEEIYELAQMRTRQKTGGVSEWQVDHIVPLQSKLVCGLHVEHNLQVIPAKQNLQKGNRSWPDMPDRIVDSKGESIRGTYF